MDPHGRTFDDVNDDSAVVPRGHERALTREEALKLGIGAGLALAAAPFLGSDTARAGGFGSTAVPRRGGRLRVATTASSVESLDPNSGRNISEAMNIFDRLATIAPSGNPQLELAEVFEPSRDARQWTIRLRRGVTWHDGSPLVADDLIYSLRRMGADDSTLPGKGLMAPVRLNALSKVDNRTVRVPLKFKHAQLLDSWAAAYFLGIVKNGTTDFTAPVGTGPFVFVSHTPGTTICRRNANYWKSGRPYVNELHLLALADSGARFNALIGGQVDAAADLPFPLARRELKAGRITVLVSPSPSCAPITMAVDRAPFRDVRVRQAMRLIAGRPQLIQSVQNGFGALGNDLFARGFRFYADDLPQRRQDIDRAKSLLKAAGRSDLAVTLNTSTSVSGMLESATAFAEQAKRAGVRITLNNIPSDQYFTDRYYLKMPFGQTYWSGGTVVSFFEQALISSAPYNETHWKNRKFDALFQQARAASNPKLAAEIYDDLQRTLWEEGGYLIWGFVPFIDGLAKRVRGFVPSPVNHFSNYTYRDAWLA